MNKKQKRNQYSIGKDYFDFDYVKERNIYCYLWGIKTYKKGVKRLPGSEKFEHYPEWEKYVIRKYNGYSLEKLNEFSRYLGHRLKNLKVYIESWNIVVPIILTLLITVIFDLLVDTSMYKPEVKVAFSISAFLGLFVGFVVVLSIIFVAYIKLLSDIIAPIWDNHTEENILTDYKEIIDNLIGEKERCNEKRDTTKNGRRKR